MGESRNKLQNVNFQEGEAAGYAAEDVQVARALCGDANPVSRFLNLHRQG